MQSLAEPLLPAKGRAASHGKELWIAALIIGGIPMVALYHSGTSTVGLPTSAFAQESIGVELWETSEAGARLKRIDNPAPALNAKPDLILLLRPEKEQQRVLGFGGALTQATGTVWQRLKSSKLRDQVVNLYFSSSGIDANIARVPIGSCDFAERSYSLDDVPGDFKLSRFDDALTEDERLLLPLVRRALRAGGSPLRLLASPWSPPAWMKSNNAMSGNGAPRGLRAAAATAWAAYIGRWLAAWSDHGANVSMLTVQNEPLAPSPWESCFFDLDQEARFIADHLGPTLADGATSGRHPPVDLFGFDDQKDHISEWSERLLASSPASSFVAGIAYHVRLLLPAPCSMLYVHFHVAHVHSHRASRHPVRRCAAGLTRQSYAYMLLSGTLVITSGLSLRPSRGTRASCFLVPRRPMSLLG